MVGQSFRQDCESNRIYSLTVIRRVSNGEAVRALSAVPEFPSLLVAVVSLHSLWPFHHLVNHRFLLKRSRFRGTLARR